MRIYAQVIAFCLLPFSSVFGALVFIEPDDAPEGALISNFYPGVTLSAFGDPGVLINSNVFSMADPFSVTGTRVFASTGERPTGWGYNNYRYLRADFTNGATQVLLDFAADDANASNGFLRAYNSSNTLIASASTGFVPLGSPTTLSVSAPDIAYVLASWDDILQQDRGVMDNLRFEPIVVPEPSSILLIGAGVGVLCIARKRSKIPSKLLA